MTQQLPSSNLRWMLIIIAAVALSAFLWQIRSILLYGLAAIIFVILITIPVGQLGRLGVGRLPAIIITMVVLVLFSAVLVMIVLPTLVDQFAILGDQIGRGIEEVIRRWNSGEIHEQFPFLRDIELFEVSEQNRISIETLRNVAQQGLDTLGQLGGTVLPFIGGIANTLLSLLIVLFLTLFLLAEPNTYKDGFIKLFPLWYRHRIRHILERLNYLLRRWIYATIIGMIITGIGTYLGLSAVGIQQAGALAIMTSFLSFVPNFGELFAVLISLAVGLVQAPDRLVWIVIVIYGVSFVQGQLIMPLITSESVKIPPVLILLGQIIVARFFGVTGIILAVPILVIVMVLVQEVYVRDILGDVDEVPEAHRVLRKEGLHEHEDEQPETLRGNELASDSI